MDDDLQKKHAANMRAEKHMMNAWNLTRNQARTRLHEFRAQQAAQTPRQEAAPADASKPVPPPPKITSETTSFPIRTAIAGQGKDGTNGADGNQGDQGDQGNQGNQGTQGTQGEQGEQGNQGDQGPQGFQGFQGFQGDQGQQGFQGFQGDQGPQGNPAANTGPQGDQGPQGFQGDKLAIVPSSNGPVQLVCVEAPEVRFEDVIALLIPSTDSVLHRIDPLFLEVCEPYSIEVVSICANFPFPCGGQVLGGKLLIRAAAWQEGLRCVVKLSGIRKGRAGVRFKRSTEEEMRLNSAFWSSWRTNI